MLRGNRRAWLPGAGESHGSIARRGMRVVPAGAATLGAVLLIEVGVEVVIGWAR